MAPSSPLAFRNDVVALFPGQGSLTGGAGIAWRDSPHWEQVARISAAAEVDVEYLLTRASSDEVVRTDRAQIATFALSMVCYFELLDLGLRPRFLLGHSLGEFSALAASGLLSIEEASRLIAVRGDAMARAAELHPGSMVALMGGSEQSRDALATVKDVWVANINGTGQIVVSGTRGGLDEVLARHKELGWRRATPLAVGGAFHSPLMASAQSQFDAALARTEWGTTCATLIANVDGRVHTDAGEWSELLSRQLTSPVEFLDATLALPTSVTASFEVAPAGVLTGLTRRIRPFDVQYSPTTLNELRELTL